MTTEIFNGTSIGAGNRFTQNGSDRLVLLDDANVGSESEHAVLSTGDGNTVVVFGVVSAFSSALVFEDTGNIADGAIVEVGPTGVVNSFLAGAGVFVEGRGALIDNAGYISGVNGIFLDTILSIDGNHRVSNSGVIRGNIMGINGDDIDKSQISNSGQIRDGDSASSNFGSGDIGELKGGIVVEGDQIIVNNSGEIIGSTSLSYGIAIQGDAAEVLNSGLVQTNSNDPDRAAVDLISSASETSLLVNAEGGRIVSKSTAVQTGAGTDTVRNSGVIEGNVELQDGDDNFVTKGDGRANGEVRGGNGADELKGGLWADELSGNGDKDTLKGKAGDDTLSGGGDRDILKGGEGHDMLSGGGSKDLLDGGRGDDTLAGGAAADTLKGGRGDDVFLFESSMDSPGGGTVDVIRDFSRGEDAIQLTMRASTPFEFIGGDSFSGTGVSEVRVRNDGPDDTRVTVDTDGDGTADFRVTVLGVQGLEESDFIL